MLDKKSLDRDKILIAVACCGPGAGSALAGKAGRWPGLVLCRVQRQVAMGIPTYGHGVVY